MKNLTRSKLYFLSLILLSFLIQGCVTVQEKRTSALQIKGLIIKNLTGNPISEISLKAKSNGRFVSCGYIATGGECSTTFPLKEYQRNLMIVSWTQYNQQYLYNDIVVSQTSVKDTSLPVHVLIEIRQNGQPLTRFIQLDNEWTR